MNSRLLFMIACIPARIGIAYVVKEYSTPILALPLLAISLSFLFLYFTNSRMNAVEASGGKTWWAEYRLLHGLLYLAASIYTLRGKNEEAFLALIIDVLFGLSVFTTR
jgi:hypothetical protein